ncbi:MAG: hypothetical protein ASARMPRED_002168, partial [Alectoria sarmentosa]
PNNLVQIRLEALGEKEKEDLTYQAGLFFLDLLKTEKTDSELMLCPGEIPTLRIGEPERPQLGNKNLRDDQLCLIHAVDHWCKDRDGNDIAESIRMDMIADHYGLKVGKQANITFRRLTDPNIPVNEKVAAVAEKHSDFFRRKVLDVQTKYEKEKLGLPDRPTTDMQKEYEREVLGLPLQPVIGQ